MKTHTFTLLLCWLLLLASNLIAQNIEGRFKLNEGDWFEVEVERNTSDHEINNWLLRYQLMKQLPNKNQQYQISIEHFKSKIKDGSKYLGYDSYYPTFEENKTTPETKNQFSLEVTPTGKVNSLTAFKSNKHREITLTEIGSSYQSFGTITRSERSDIDIDSLFIRLFSTNLMLVDSLPHESIISNNRVPMLVKIPHTKLVLTNASFPLTNNAIIQGRLKDQLNQDITINLIGENSDSNFPEKSFRTTSDGSFTCPIFLKRPLHLKIQVGNKTMTTFMEPGDTLNITEIGHQAREIEYNQYAETKPKGYFSPDMNKSDYISGTAAYNTMLSNEMDQYRTGFLTESDVPSVIMKDKETKIAVNQLIESYRGKASKECISYFQSDMKYFMAFAKLYFNEHQQNYYTFAVVTKKIPNTDNKFPKLAYPTDYFLEVDTMSILMNPYEWNSSYQNFIEKVHQFKQNRLGWAAARRFSGNFLESYYFNQASLQGYPLYKQIAKSIDLELRKGLADNNNVTPYYQDFINNCADPALTEPLKKTHNIAEQFKIGNAFPFKTFVLQDSTIFSLEDFKGKPICLVLFDGSKSFLNQLKDDIEKFNPEEVEFILARSSSGWIESELDTAMLKLPNVTYIELPRKYLISELLVERTKIFMLDKWFRIVENNAEDPMTNEYKGGISKFEKSLRNTIDAKRYSKAEKSALLKTAGWSLGSILFTLLVGWWIYRIRIRQIKRQEEAKRRIKELEIKAIRSQMNPHFIFNALNSIQSLINGNQFKEANIYLSKFAVLLRGVLNNSEKSRVSLSDELQAVELYCQLEQLRFEFKYEIHIDDDVNDDLIEIPGMIIQPLAENAVVHGISGKGNEGKLNIQVSRQNGHVCIGVADNGVGLSSQVKDTLSQKGFGLKLVEERINILNLEGKEARLTLKNRKNNSGTLATLIIPID